MASQTSPAPPPTHRVMFMNVELLVGKLGVVSVAPVVQVAQHFHVVLDHRHVVMANVVLLGMNAVVAPAVQNKRRVARKLYV